MSEQTPETPAADAPATEETPETPPKGTEETPKQDEGKPPKTYDEKTVKDLRQEAAGYRTRLREEEAKVTKVTEELETVRAEAARVPALETELNRYKVALEKGLPADAVSRLVGNTPEELAADADVLVGLLAPRLPGAGNANGIRTSLEPPNLQTQIAEAEAKGDTAASIRLKSQLAFEQARASIT
jgi:hypothetical protein